MMTEADKLFEKTTLKAEEPVLMPVADAVDCVMVGEDSFVEDENFFDEMYADQVPQFQPQTKKAAISRLKLAEQQFNNGQWHSLEEVLDMVRRNIA